MNWDTYKQLTFEQREEYKYRFGNKPQPSCRGVFLMLLVLTSTVSMMMLTSFVIFTSKEFVELKDMYSSIMEGTLQIVQVGVGIIIIYILTDVVRFIYYYGRLWRWKKKYNIKRQKETFWW